MMRMLVLVSLCGWAVAQLPTPVSQWGPQWSTAACTGPTVAATCADLANFTLVQPTASNPDGYFWTPATGSQHLVCLPVGVPMGSGPPHPCGTATFQIYCSGTTYVNFVGEGQASVRAGNDDSFWTYLDGVESVNRVTYVATGFRLQPAWTYRLLRPSPTLFRQGTHTITLAEREDGTRMRRVGISMGYPVCQFGAPPAAPNNTADSVLARVLTLETQTNNRVSAMSTGSAALNATVQALSASVSSSQSMVMVSVSQQVSTLRASVLSTTNSLQSQVTAQASTGTAVSTAMSSLSARLGTVGAFGTGGGGGALPAAPQLGRSGRDVAIAAGAGGTVRIQGAQCQSDLCSLVSQVSQLTDALRQT
eukprot:m.191660 g.191660  ORF g.191660 m.191660 type:complete len:364 (-) comp24933_c0_seq2:834-1925(-)